MPLPKFIPLPNSYVVHLEADYGHQQLLHCSSKNPLAGEPIITIGNFPEPPTQTRLSTFNGTLFPDLFCTRNPPSEPYYLNLKKGFNNKRQDLYDVIYGKGKLLLEEYLQLIVSSCGFSIEEAEAITKVELARALNIKFLDQKGGGFITLSTLRKSHEDKKRFLGSITDELNANSNRIDYLISHSQTKGNFREFLLRNILKKYIPQKFTVATGFIENCARQCDIIIYDSQNYSPFFKEDELVVVPEKSVRAVIEVKTTLQTNSLTESLELLDEVAGRRSFPAPFFKGIFAFKTDYKEVSSIARAIKEFYQIDDDYKSNKRGVEYLFQVVDAVSVISSHHLEVSLLDLKREDRTVRPRLYSAISDQDSINISGSCFFAKLFSFLDVDHIAKRNNNSYFEALDVQIKFKLEEELVDQTWIPTWMFHNEHENTSESIMNRLKDVIHWQQGFVSMEELENKYFGEIMHGFDPDSYYKNP